MLFRSVLASVSSSAECGRRFVPAPVVLDLNRVGAHVEQDLACRNGRPDLCRRQEDLRASRAVQDYIRVLVAVGSVV